MDTISLSIQDLLDDDEYGLDLSLISGTAGLDHRVTSSRLQKPGLALTGYTSHLHPDRIQILGNTEISYLNQLDEELLRENARALCRFPISCFIVTKGLVPPPFFLEATGEQGIPVLGTNHQSSTFISLVTKFLEERLLPTTHLHGVLVDVLGVGVLLTGKSGIGKSECALELIIRGHRLVSDDMVFIKKKMPAALVGQPVEQIQYLMEIRGLGIINIKDLYGVSSIREKKIVDLMVELVEWNPNQEYDRLGVDDHTVSILGVELPHLTIPVRPGRNLGAIIEVAARNFLLKGMGYHSARDFQARLLARMESRPLGDEVE
ncbi:HPr(Ser) kinase/phosphatase [Trichlorobacter ammonificans]|uniref:HPr kinase/phosphorylase n=1 Tax=Trichlorobacter ammonificans TaxID=2916410 RepID=A0ABM9D8I6_9BACT|nr:HPr(Ser) kinase/phosphatase [Trichlorobacter ammonificans]CAH2030699.1 HPr kinase/phosphorylase [Trichlorobacter ammonificans]